VRRRAMKPHGCRLNEIGRAIDRWSYPTLVRHRRGCPWLNGCFGRSDSLGQLSLPKAGWPGFRRGLSPVDFWALSARDPDPDPRGTPVPRSRPDTQCPRKRFSELKTPRPNPGTVSTAPERDTAFVVASHRHVKPEGTLFIRMGGPKAHATPRMTRLWGSG
jgi:hypothetical protein